MPLSTMDQKSSMAIQLLVIGLPCVNTFTFSRLIGMVV